jgi:hypothetical protein
MGRGDLRVELVEPGTPEAGDLRFGYLGLMLVLFDCWFQASIGTYRYTTE